MEPMEQLRSHIISHPLFALPFRTPLGKNIPAPDQAKAAGVREERRHQKRQIELRAVATERVRSVVPLGGAMLNEIERVLEVLVTSSRLQA